VKVDTSQQIGGRGHHAAQFGAQIRHRRRPSPTLSFGITAGLQHHASILELDGAVDQPDFDLVKLKADSRVVGGPFRGGVDLAA
jgi:hypothetical protein